MEMDAIKFVLRNKIDLSLLNDDNPFSRLLTDGEISELTRKNFICKKQEIKNVSVGDILGGAFEQKRGLNIFKTIPEYFDSEGDNYHSRSVSMLQYGVDDIIKKLALSFENEPMVLKECDQDAYTIYGNGLHRFTVLRCLYINEWYKCFNEPDKVEELKKKFMVPAHVYEIDFIKSYCSYIIEYLIGMVYCFDAEFGGYNNLGYREYTGSTVVTNRIDGSLSILTDDELISFTKDIIEKNKRWFKFLIRDALKYKTFKDFLEKQMHYDVDALASEYGIVADEPECVLRVVEARQSDSWIKYINDIKSIVNGEKRGIHGRKRM